MKYGNWYRVYFVKGSSMAVHAISKEAAKIVAQANRIENGYCYEVKTVKRELDI